MWALRTLPRLHVTYRRAMSWGALWTRCCTSLTLLPLPSGPQPPRPSSPFWTQQSPGCSSLTCCSLLCLIRSSSPRQSSHGQPLLITHLPSTATSPPSRLLPILCEMNDWILMYENTANASLNQVLTKWNLNPPQWCHQCNRVRSTQIKNLPTFFLFWAPR